jgi:hypothetical protein
MTTLSQLSCPSCPVLLVMVGHPVLSVLSWLTCPGLSVRLTSPERPRAVLSYSRCSVMAVASWLSCRVCPALVFLNILLLRRKITALSLQELKIAKCGRSNRRCLQVFQYEHLFLQYCNLSSYNNLTFRNFVTEAVMTVTIHIYYKGTNWTFIEILYNS